MLLDRIDRVTESGTGFLPPLTPLRSMPEPFRYLDEACAALPDRYHGEGVDCRPWLKSVFDDGPRGGGDPPWTDALDALDRHAVEGLMTRVSLLAHAYRWRGMPTDPALYEIPRLTLPPALEALWTETARRLDVPRVGLFYTMICQNWTLAGREGGAEYEPRELLEGDVDILYPWLRPPEREQVRTFVTTALRMEAHGQDVLRQIGLTLRAIARDNPQEVTFRLVLIENEIAKVASTFNRGIRTALIDPHAFLTLIQPTMVWLLDHGDGPLEGASGPQACTIQVLDGFLGVPRHTELGSKILEARAYMLPDHRELVEEMDRAGALLERFVEGSGEVRIREVYNRCIRTLVSWRISHQKRGAIYLDDDGRDAETPYTSTGMVVTVDDDRTEHFTGAMQTHIDATRSRSFEGVDGDQDFDFDYLFRYLDEGSREAMRARLVTRTFERGARILAAGDRYPGLFVLTSGRAGVYRVERGREPQLVGEVREREIFGEISLIEHGGAIADVVATTDVETLFLSVEDLYELVAEQPGIEASLYLSLGRILADKLKRMNEMVAGEARRGEADGEVEG